MPLRSRGVCLDLFAFIVSYLATDTSAVLVRPFVSPLHLSVYVPVVSVCSFIRCFSVCCCCACVCLLRCDALRGLWPSFASFVVLIRRNPPRDGRRGCELPTDHRPSSFWPRRRAAPRARVGSAWRLHRALSAYPLALAPPPCLLVSLGRVRPVSVHAYRYSCAHRPSADHPYSTPNVPPPFLRVRRHGAVFVS